MVANFFIDRAREAGDDITQMKLQKLVYFAHGWYLALTNGQPLINEQVEAWRHGPVIRSLYREFREFGNKPIDRRALKYDVRHDDGIKFSVSEPSISDLDESQRLTLSKFLNRIWEVYRGFSAVQLSIMTHSPGSPWHQTWQPMAENPIKGTDIPNDLIRRYFQEQSEH